MLKKSLIILLALSSSLPVSETWSADGGEFQTLRSNMVREIFADVQLTRLKIRKNTLDRKVMKAMGEVPRHLFVPKKQRGYAYENRPLSIGYGQTISQPYIVALMTDLLQPDEQDIVLEIGTGSGYQAAVLAGLVKKVYTIEIVEALGEAASDRLAGLGYDNITTRIGDGYYGWKEYAPFDTIIVTAAAGSIPPPLIRQLKPGGRMIIPVGGAFLTQQLILIEKDLEEKIKTRQILPVRFVPLTRSRTAD